MICLISDTIARHVSVMCLQYSEYSFFLKFTYNRFWVPQRNFRKNCSAVGDGVKRLGFAAKYANNKSSPRNILETVGWDELRTREYWREKGVWEVSSIFRPEVSVPGILLAAIIFFPHTTSSRGEREQQGERERWRRTRSPVKAFALKLCNLGRKFAFELSGKPRRSISPTFLILLLPWARLAPHCVLVLFSVPFFVLLFTYFSAAGHVAIRKKNPELPRKNRPAAASALYYVSFSTITLKFWYKFSVRS